MSARVLFLVGPTAVGKSEIAIECALRLGGEIVSADSMLVYRGLDIGTAKPSREDRLRVPHHLIDIVSCSETFSVSQYRDAALAALKGIAARGRVPIVAGGSGLYVRALLEGLSSQPGADAGVRSKLEGLAREAGLEPLYRRLRDADPETAAKIKPQDKRRIVRALEILEISGRPPGWWYRAKTPLRELGFEPCVIGLYRERAELYDAIESRVEQMFQKGFAGEVQRLAHEGMAGTAAQALGYKEMLAALEAGKALEGAVPLIKRNTRRFAKRQMTWFRKEKGIVWIERKKNDDAVRIADRILALWQSSC